MFLSGETCPGSVVVMVATPTGLAVRPGLTGQESAEAVVPAGMCLMGWEGLNVK